MTVTQLLNSGIIDINGLSKQVYGSKRKLYCKINEYRNYKLFPVDYQLIADYMQKNFQIILDTY